MSRPRTSDQATSRAGLLRTVAATVATIAATLALAEVACVVAHDSIFRSSIYTYDAELGFRVRPHARWVGGRANAFGFNDRERSRRKPVGTLRVMVLGDSFNWAGGLEGNYPALLERRLATALGPRVIEVLNVGYPGTHTGEQLALLRRDGLQFEPDLVVLGFFIGNDFLDAQPGRKVVPIGGVLTPVDADRTRALFGRLWVPRSHLLRFFGSRWTLWRLRREARAEAVNAEQDAVPLLPNNAYWAIVRDRMRVAVREPSPALLAAEAYVEEQLRAMRDLLHASGTGLIVAAHPDEFQVDAELRRVVVERFNVDPLADDWDRPQRRLAAICEALGIAMVDLLPPFHDALARGERLYLPNDSHWNAAGNAAAAEFLTNVVLRWRASLDQE